MFRVTFSRSLGRHGVARCGRGRRLLMSRSGPPVSVGAGQKRLGFSISQAVFRVGEIRSFLCENGVRRFSSAAEELGEAEYHLIADGFLESLEPAFEELPGFEEFDVVYSQGVLTLDLGSNGTWVLNKQTPNRQIWWSSPISGPKRYYYDSTDCTWKNTRDSHKLLDLLNSEISSIFKTTLQL